MSEFDAAAADGRAADKAVSSVLGDTVGSVAGGFVAGGESILNAPRGLADAAVTGIAGLFS